MSIFFLITEVLDLNNKAQDSSGDWSSSWSKSSTRHSRTYKVSGRNSDVIFVLFGYRYDIVKKYGVVIKIYTFMLQ